MKKRFIDEGAGKPVDPAVAIRDVLARASSRDALFRALGVDVQDQRPKSGTIPECGVAVDPGPALRDALSNTTTRACLLKALGVEPQ